MALFRKFFLKKTPDRLLEISERVYGIMLSSRGRAGPAGCGICAGVAFWGGFFLLWRGLGTSDFGGVMLYGSLIMLQFSALEISSVGNILPNLVEFEYNFRA